LKKIELKLAGKFNFEWILVFNREVYYWNIIIVSKNLSITLQVRST